MSKDYFTIPLEFWGKRGDLRVSVYKTEQDVADATKGFDNWHEDTIAYTDCYTLEENKDVVGHMFVALGVEGSVVAHESVHLALGILNRMGYKRMPITADAAPEIEEKLASLVGAITGIVAEDLQDYGVTVTGEHKTLRKQAPITEEVE